MNVAAIWNNDLGKSLISSSNIHSDIDNLLDVIECARKDGALTYHNYSIYDEEVDDTTFSDWLYNGEHVPECADAKRELSKYLHKSTILEVDEYDYYLKEAENPTDKKSLTICFSFSPKCKRFVCEPNQYWEAKQEFLSENTTKDKFIEEAIGCFPNLFFHENAAVSINTLNTDFRIIRPILVKHLHFLNKYKLESTIRLNGADFRTIAHEIESLYGIECSTQAGRSSTKMLKFDFYNRQTKSTVILCCELHTKPKWDGMDRKNQDRIYFHSGNPEIEDGKILVVHIGTHA